MNRFIRHKFGNRVVQKNLVGGTPSIKKTFGGTPKTIGKHLFL